MTTTRLPQLLKLWQLLDYHSYSSYDNYSTITATHATKTTLGTTITQLPQLLIKEVLPEMGHFVQDIKLYAMNKFFLMQYIERGFFCAIQWFVIECDK